MFYKKLKEGLPKDEALRQAKLTYLEQAKGLAAHPFFWAAFVQIGNNSPIIIHSSWISWIYGIAGLILLVIIVGLGKRLVIARQKVEV